MYELQYKKKAIKALAKINDPYYTAIMEAIDGLTENPRPHGYKKTYWQKWLSHTCWHLPYSL